MRERVVASALVGVCSGIWACGGGGDDTPATPTRTATVIPTETPTATPRPTADLLVGLKALTDLTALAGLRPPGVRAGQVSSYDRTGGNSDLGLGPDSYPYLERLGLELAPIDNSHLYRDADDYVIFDSVGPGVVYRIWMTGLDALLDGEFEGTLAFELDGERVPRLELPRADVFTGETAPFLFPLAAPRSISSGGFFSVLPIPYEQRLRILSSVEPNWMSITYLQLPPDRLVESFDPEVDSEPAADALATIGVDPKKIVATIDEEAAVSLATGEVKEIWSYEGGGTVLGLELTGPPAAELPEHLRLRATWDDAAEPQVDVPLDELFYATLGDSAQSFALGRDGDRFYCYFPMPFLHSARVELRNEGSTPFEDWQLRVTAVDRLLAPAPAYFSAHYRRASLAADGDDFVMLESPGTGHVVSVSVTASCPSFGACSLPGLPGNDGLHLEGDEHFYIDGSRYPQLHGTGLEDFFNGGFYFLGGPFSLPTHGNPSQAEGSDRFPGRTMRSAYRLFLGDAIPFYAGIRVAIEHGPVNDKPAEMSSTVLYYGIPEPTLIETDYVDVGDAESERGHAFTAALRSDVALTSSFRGDASDVSVSAVGVEAARTTFRVAIDSANRGVRLRRLADIGAGAQAAEVFVDGEPAGIWYSADVNSYLRWAELDFDLPQALTSGRSFIDVELDAGESPTPWTAFEYRVFSYRDPR